MSETVSLIPYNRIASKKNHYNISIQLRSYISEESNEIAVLELILSSADNYNNLNVNRDFLLKSAKLERRLEG